jgi:HTH-type transcriptional regulator/antitoxin HigA
MPALDQSTYNELYPLKAIRTDQDYREALESMKMVFDETEGELAEYAETLSILIEYYESKHFPIADSTGIDVLRFLMDQNGLKQKDLVGILGGKSSVSEILNSKRPLNLHHLKALAEKFNVHPSTFL